jgi:hypothetical protein
LADEPTACRQLAPANCLESFQLDTKSEHAQRREKRGFVERCCLNVIETIVPIGEYRPKSARGPEAEQA